MSVKFGIGEWKPTQAGQNEAKQQVDSWGQAKKLLSPAHSHLKPAHSLTTTRHITSLYTSTACTPKTHIAQK